MTMKKRITRQPFYHLIKLFYQETCKNESYLSIVDNVDRRVKIEERNAVMIFLEEYPSSRKELLQIFTEEEINNAEKRYRINWKEIAVYAIRTYAVFYKASVKGTINHLRKMEFTTEEIHYAVNQLRMNVYA